MLLENNGFPTNIIFNSIGSENKYDFEGFFIYDPIHGKYIIKTYYNGYEQIVSLYSILFYRYDHRENVLIYKLYHLCKDLREKHTKKEIHYAALEDKMAEMRIKDTYTEETEQIRRDILEYKQKCTSYIKSIEELQKKCLTLKIANTELEKKCKANINIEDISKEPISP